MDKTIIIIIIISVIILGGIIWLEQPSRQDKAASVASLYQGALDVQETSFDFGVISMAAGPVKHAFQIKNTEEEALLIEKIYTSCMCTTALLLADGEKFGPFGMQGHGFTPKINKKLDPGKEVQVEVEFDPAAHGPSGVGYVERVVYLETSAGLEQLEIRAQVKP